MTAKKISTADLNRFKKMFPEAYTELQKRVHTDAAQKVTEEEERLIRDRQLAEARKVAAQRLQLALTVIEAPSLDLRDVQGFIALRSWRISPTGLLQSAAFASTWSTVMMADKIPTMQNSHGLYCLMILPEYITDIIGLSALDVHGLVEVRGHIVEHTDGTLRAEWAKLLHLFVNADLLRKVYYTTKCVHDNYPHLPIDVLNKKQLSTVLFKVALQQYTRLKGM